jgi:hypothetical protein
MWCYLCREMVMYKYISIQNARIVLLFPPRLRPLAGKIGVAVLVGGIAYIMSQEQTLTTSISLK